MTQHTDSQLDRLNFLLEKNDFSIPSFRLKVSDSGTNLSWLKKHLSPKLKSVIESSDSLVRDVEIAKELITLLSLTIGQLKAANKG